MGRRRGSVLDMLLVSPWWVAVAMGVVGYLLIVYVPPLLVTEALFAPAARGLEPVARIWALICGLAAIGSAVRGFFVARKFNQQNSLDDVRSLSWRQFESVVGEAFRRRGYLAIENANEGADGGVDLVLRKDGEKFFVQCKQWKKSSVGVKPIRELLGVVSAHEAAGGFFVTSGTYTADARDFARKSGIELIDGEGLQRMIEEVRSPEPFLDPTQRRRSVGVTFGASSAPSFPSCGSGMVERVARRGANAGARFWGCSGYPRCRGTRHASEPEMGRDDGVPGAGVHVDH
jgi:restriction system protein